jgi:hypothetical protein
MTKLVCVRRRRGQFAGPGAGKLQSSLRPFAILEVATGILRCQMSRNAKMDLLSAAKEGANIAIRPKGALAAHYRKCVADRNAENGEDVTVLSLPV